MKKMTLVGAIIIALFAWSSLADDEASWVVSPSRIDQPLIIDGHLTDSVWANAAKIDNFTQQDPDFGQPVSEQTEVYLLYSSTHLYIGIIFFDKEPDKIVRNIFGRDGPMNQDDSIIIAIDANNDNRTAVQLAMNANGARLDREILDGGLYNDAFNFHWRVETSVDERGVTFEVEIPFSALSFKPSEENEMGLLFRRKIPRKNEVSYWPALSRNYDFATISEYGRMVGLKDLDVGRNVELIPSFIGGGTQSNDGDDLEADVSFDARWGITPNIILDVTANTDFAQVESDELQSNLTRFNLFFPEKRKFFLENSNAFIFGLRDEAEIFFSRRIGINNGKEVPILGGVRLNGIVGATNFGFLSMQTDSTSEIRSENFTVGRVKQNFLDRSTVGAVFTKRSGFDQEADTTVGFDFRHLWGSTNIIFLDTAKSDRSQLDEGQWFLSTGYYYESDLYEAFVHYVDVGENFSPGIGFVRRPDQRRLFVSGAYRPRPSWDAVRKLNFSGSYGRIETHAGILESENIKLLHNTFFETNDFVSVQYTDDFEFISVPFEIAPNVVIPPGEYKFNRLGVGYSTDPARVLSSEASYATGSFYGGDIQRITAFFYWKATPRLHLLSNNELNKVDLPGGSFESNIFRLLASYDFSPDLNVRVASQYSSLDESLIFNMRMRWIFGEESEAWLVYDEDHDFGLPFDTLQNRALIGKLVFRFGK